jgi:Protein of unknown function (DUF1367)
VDHYLVKTNAGLAAADERTEEALRGLGVGEIVAVKIKRPRNIRHHRLFFALLNAVFENQDKYLSVEGFRFALIIAAGYADEVRLDGDKVVLKPRSLSFGSMGQDEFAEFYAAALAAVPRLLPQYEGVDIEREILPRADRL